MEELRLKLDNFEGPLDLLLHLLQKKELTIEEIEISKLLLIQDIYQGKDVVIPKQLSLKNLSLSYQFYDPLFRIIHD